MNMLSISTTLSNTITTMLSLATLMMTTTSYAEALGPIDRISESSSGQFGNGYSYSYENNANHLSADGRYVAFYSYATNLVNNDTSGSATNIFVYDHDTDTMELVSRASSDINGLGAQGNDYSYTPSISADGRYVAFYSYATNLVDNDTNNRVTDIFVYDRDTDTIELVNRASSDINGLGVQANNYSYTPSISADGRYVAFYSYATNLVDNDTNGLINDILVYDRDTDTIELVSRASSDMNGLGAQGNHYSYNPSISADGRYVAFQSFASNLVDNDTNGHMMDIFVYDRDTDTTKLVSRASSDINGLGAPGNQHSYAPSISADGRYVAFFSYASNLVDNDTNGHMMDIFVYDLDTDTTELVSRASSDANGLGAQGNNHSTSPFISADGRYVAFHSQATNLVDNDINVAYTDIFVYDRDTDTIELVSTTETGEQGNHHSYRPILSPDGSAVMFMSYAQNFDGPYNYHQVFVKQLSSNTAPVAQAGSDQVVEATANPNSDVTLDGSGSSDEEGDSSTYIWTGDFGEVTGESVTIALPLGTHIITLTVSDGALSSSDDLTIIVEDTTPPILTPPTDVQVYASGMLTSVDLGEAEATDLFDVTVSNNAPDQFSPGVTEVTWTATDANGNSATAIQIVTVIYEFVGFYSPIESLPVLNVAKAGQVIPVKWSVPSSDGGYISDTTIVSSVQFSTASCNEDTIASTDISDAESNGKTGLRYDDISQQFIFNWKTSKSMKGSCYMLHLNLSDGQVYQAKFMLR